MLLMLLNRSCCCILPLQHSILLLQQLRVSQDRLSGCSFSALASKQQPALAHICNQLIPWLLVVGYAQVTIHLCHARSKIVKPKVLHDLLFKASMDSEVLQRYVTLVSAIHQASILAQSADRDAVSKGHSLPSMILTLLH